MKELNLKYLEALSKKCRYDIVRMIGNAGSGHIGGALSSIDIYVLLRYVMEDSDRLVVSHGHSSAAIYAALGNMGYFEIEGAVETFRKSSPFEGHPSIYVNGIEWCSGSLGQGLSVGCGFALAKKLKNERGKVYVVMGDGEQQKGQLQEAREFAAKYKLDNLVAVIDCNELQASGTTEEINGQSIAAKYYASGWKTEIVDGHAFKSMYNVVKNAEGPLCILASTVMGRGIPEIENNYKYHGTVIDKELEQKSLERFRLNESEEKLLKQSKNYPEFARFEYPRMQYTKQTPYKIGEKVDVRSGLGKALYDLAVENSHIPMAVLDCDLEGSVKLTDFKKQKKRAFIECGIAEHNAATVAAALSKSGMLAVHADFSVFNIAETYSQNRMADMNKAPVKLLCTHAGLDVGEDGKTHQCIEYLSLMSNLLGFQVIVPADANQAVCAVRYAMSVDKAVAIIGGRSRIPILSYENGRLLDFEYGRADWLLGGKDGVIVTYGNMVHRAFHIAQDLKDNGLEIGVLNVSTPIDLDEEQIIEAAKTGIIITYEDHNIRNGIGNYVAQIFCKNEICCKLLCKGVTKYGSSMSPDQLYMEQGLDEESMKKAILKLKEEKQKC